MKLHRSKKHCLLCAAAMVLDVHPYELEEAFEFVGDKVAWPESPFPNNLRGYHESEIIATAISMGVALVRYMPNPCIKGATVIPIYTEDQQRTIFTSLMTGRRAIIILRVSDGATHAVAWDGEWVHDPARATPYRMEKLRHQPLYVLLAFKINNEGS